MTLASVRPYLSVPVGRTVTVFPSVKSDVALLRLVAERLTLFRGVDAV